MAEGRRPYSAISCVIENGLEVSPGPKYHVYLVKKKDVKNSSDVKDAEFKHLGRLRAFRGSQNYPIPEGVNPRDYASVVIWCETFGGLILPDQPHHQGKLIGPGLAGMTLVPVPLIYSIYRRNLGIFHHHRMRTAVTN